MKNRWCRILLLFLSFTLLPIAGNAVDKEAILAPIKREMRKKTLIMQKAKLEYFQHLQVRKKGLARLTHNYTWQATIEPAVKISDIKLSLSNDGKTLTATTDVFLYVGPIRQEHNVTAHLQHKRLWKNPQKVVDRFINEQVKGISHDKINQYYHTDEASRCLELREDVLSSIKYYAKFSSQIKKVNLQFNRLKLHKGDSIDCSQYKEDRYANFERRRITYLETKTKEKTCPTGSALQGLQCFGSYCLQKMLFCRFYSTDQNEIYNSRRGWGKEYSEEGSGRVHSNSVENIMPI